MTDFILFLPETVCLLAALAVFVAQVAGARYTVGVGSVAGWGLAAVAACIHTWPLSGEPFFPGIYRVDFFSQLVKTFLAAGFLVVAAVARQAAHGPGRRPGPSCPCSCC